jgi:hypothetical protein
VNTHLTEAGELTRRFDLAQRAHHQVRPSLPTPRRRDQVASRLRRFADRLEQ